MKKNEKEAGQELNNKGTTLALLHTVAGGRKKSFAEIARYILANYHDVAHLNLYHLAEKTGTSTATVSRFSVYLGYKNYRAFQLDMVSSAVRESAVSDIFQKDDTPATIIRRVFELGRKNLKDTEALVDTRVLVNVARLIINARRVIFFGVGSSGLIGRLGAIRFEGLGISTAGVNDPYEGLLMLSSADRRDIVIGVSHSGRSTVTLDLLRLARKRGAYTVALTNYSDSALAKLADTAILTVFRERRINSAVSHSGISQMSVIDALYFLAAHFQGSSFEDMAEKVEENAERLLRLPAGRKTQGKKAESKPLTTRLRLPRPK